MQKKLEPKEEKKNDIKGQYAEMNQQSEQQCPPQPTAEEVEQQRKDQEANLDKALPYLRKQEEATRLEMSLTRYDVMLGRLNPTQIPGYFGKQLEVECLEVQMSWSNMKMEQQAMLKRALAEKEELEKEIASKENKETKSPETASPEAILPETK